MKTWLAFLISLSFVFKLDAQVLRHEVSSDSILLGNYFIYEIELTNFNADISRPNFDAFEIISGPNTSNSMSFINGDMTSSQKMSWYLRPTELGQYFIEPISVGQNDEVLEADPIEINVFPNPNGIIEEPIQNNSMDDFFNLKRPSLMDKVKPQAPKEEKKKPKRELKKG